MLYTINEPIMGDPESPVDENAFSKDRNTYWRVYPPPRYLIEEERLKATITYSSHANERIGRGNSALVYRVKLQHRNTGIADSIPYVSTMFIKSPTTD